ncbi:IS4 family transposase, partial [Marinibaculum pumilum]
MRHENSVFHDILKWVPWDVFDRLVDKHGSDHRVRRLRTRDQFIALLFGQLSGAVSLREVVGGLKSHEARLYHLGTRPVERSTLADANARRPNAVFGELLTTMVAQAQRGLRRKVGEGLYLIDSTGLYLAGGGAEWARFSAKVCGAKAHVIYDANADRPIYAAVTPANCHDITAAKAMPIVPGSTYVFDLGYYDYGWWAKLDAAGCRIVTRFKTNTPLSVTSENAVPEG